ncbi:unnamed protein product [Moneuplotes crassus]|uniref:Uncharacterized protein n=1 Tax=Euplotes crassus TaxID=5936 RepID=A0AAD1UPR5_EUPCR|nr:unnamed protein product [Moneuplotes crassus]
MDIPVFNEISILSEPVPTLFTLVRLDTVVGSSMFKEASAPSVLYVTSSLKFTNKLEVFSPSYLGAPFNDFEIEIHKFLCKLNVVFLSREFARRLSSLESPQMQFSKTSLFIQMLSPCCEFFAKEGAPFIDLKACDSFVIFGEIKFASELKREVSLSHEFLYVLAVRCPCILGSNCAFDIAFSSERTLFLNPKLV